MAVFFACPAGQTPRKISSLTATLWIYHSDAHFCLPTTPS